MLTHLLQSADCTVCSISFCVAFQSALVIATWPSHPLILCTALHISLNPYRSARLDVLTAAQIGDHCGVLGGTYCVVPCGGLVCANDKAYCSVPSTSFGTPYGGLGLAWRRPSDLALEHTQGPCSFSRISALWCVPQRKGGLSTLTTALTCGACRIQG